MRNVLITGGTGSLGKALTQKLLANPSIERVAIYSRDELKQSEMAREFQDPRMRYFIGDVREPVRLRRAFAGVDTIFHAAAMKQVPACEYNPFEAIQTNILGAQNVIECAIDQDVHTVIAVSTDKAVDPTNLYGATKLCQEKLFRHGGAYCGSWGPLLAVARYGNVIGSRGSVVHGFLKQSKDDGELFVTDKRMTRFWITLPQAVEFILSVADIAEPGEVHIPKIPSMNIMDLARVIDHDAKIIYTGIRPGEKIHECLLTEHESRTALEMNDRYVIDGHKGSSLPDGFRYQSDTNPQWLSDTKMAMAIATLPEAELWAEYKGILI